MGKIQASHLASTKKRSPNTEIATHPLTCHVTTPHIIKGLTLRGLLTLPRAWAQLSTHCWHHIPGLPPLSSTFIHLARIIYFISTVPVVLWISSVTPWSLEALSPGSLQPTSYHLLYVAGYSSMSTQCIGYFCACIFIQSVYLLPVRPPNSWAMLGLFNPCSHSSTYSFI